MDERDLRGLIDQVKAGRMSPPRLRAGAWSVVGLTAPMAAQMLRPVGVAQAQPKVDVQADQARRRRAAQGAVVAGPDPAQPALRRRHQGPGRLAHLLRAARRAGIADGNLRAGPGRRRSRAARTAALAADGKSVTWKLKKGVKWHDGKPFTADDVVFTWEYASDPATAAVTSRLATRTSRSRRSTSHTVTVKFQQADAVLGRRLRRRARHDHSQAPVRRLHRRQVARGADQPEAGRHRPLQVQGLQAGRPGARRASTRTTTWRIARTSTPSR